jgi:hypothetical protein
MRLFKKALPLLALAAALSAVPATTLADDADFGVRRVTTLDKLTVDVKFSKALAAGEAFQAVKADGTPDCPATPEQGADPWDFGRTSRKFYGDHDEDGLPVLPHNHYVWKVDVIDTDSRIKGAETARLSFCRALHAPTWNGGEDYEVELKILNVRLASGQIASGEADVWDTGASM